MRYLKMLGLAALAAMALTAIVGVGSASAGTAWQTTADGTKHTLAVGTTLEASLAAGTSAILKDSNNTTIDTCTGSGVKGKIEANTNTAASGAISSLTFSGCSHKTNVIKAGSLSIDGSGSVTSIGAEVTVESTVFGASCIAKTGAGTKIGTVTDAVNSTSAATMHINGSIPMGLCGTASWTGTYLVTKPLGLHAE
jgi:hypothetical protein